jgi:hypothetical protein
MKKILLLFAVSLFAFGCKQEYSEDQMKFLDPIKIPEEKGKAMKKRFKDRQNPRKNPTKYKFDLNIFEKLEDVRHLYVIPVLYSKADEVDYRRAWNMSAEDPRGNVGGYTSFVVQVGKNSDYYNFAQICPPPEPCTQEQQ